jgi:hypothetical protein
MRLLLIVLLTTVLAAHTLAQETLGGYLIQTALTPESYQITTARELQSFVSMLPKVTPFKTLPATPNPDPFVKGYSPNLDENILVIATGRDRIGQPPIFQGIEILEDGTRLVKFLLPPRTAQAYPYGWGVYTGVVLPRTEAATKVLVTTPDTEDDGFRRADFKSAKFKRI